MNATTAQREAAKNDPRVARKVVASVCCDDCDAPAETFTIDGVTAAFVCRKDYLARVVASRESRRERRYAAAGLPVPA